MRQALCAVAALAAMIVIPPTVRGGEPTVTGERNVPITTALYQPDQGVNVQQVDWRYGYRQPYYGYGYRYPSYGYRYGYRYPTYYNYRYPSYSYGAPYYGYGYGTPRYGYGYRPGVSFGFRF
jgi:hypothetical protein